MKIIDGQALAAKIRDEVKQEVQRLKTKPKLNVLLVGDDPASHLYVSLKQKAAEEVGIAVEIKKFPDPTLDGDLVDLLRQWSADDSVHAILVQLPLPENNDEARVLCAMDPKKDVDGFLPDSPSISPVHEGILRLINETPLRVNGAKAALIVNSEIFAKPLARLLTTAGMTVVVVRPDALDEQALLEADLVVIATGRAGFLRASKTKPTAVIIDVGTNKTAEGKTVGDVDMDSYQYTDAWISPVPGGVGPMTIAQLLKNVVALAKKEEE